MIFNINIIKNKITLKIIKEIPIKRGTLESNKFYAWSPMFKL